MSKRTNKHDLRYTVASLSFSCLRQAKRQGAKTLRILAAKAIKEGTEPVGSLLIEHIKTGEVAGIVCLTEA